MHTHTHTHTHTAAVVRSRAAEFITAIYYLLLYQRNVIPRRVSDACIHTAIMVHYWEVTEMEKRVLMDVGAGPAVITPSIEWSAQDTSHKMAAEHQHGSGGEE